MSGKNQFYICYNLYSLFVVSELPTLLCPGIRIIGSLVEAVLRLVMQPLMQVSQLFVCLFVCLWSFVCYC